MVKGSFEGKGTSLFIDTGSGASLVSRGFINNHKLEGAVNRSLVKLSSFTSDRIEVYGEVRLRVRIADMETEHLYIVTDIEDTDFLIGADYLRLHNITLDMGRNLLRPPTGAPLRFLQIPKQPLAKGKRKVRVCKTTTLPANSVTYTTARIDLGAQKKGNSRGAKQNSYCGYLEPYEDLTGTCGVVIPRSMVTSEGVIVPIQCMNLMDEAVELRKNELVAFFEQKAESADPRNVNVISTTPHRTQGYEPPHMQSHARYEPSHARSEPSHARPEPSHVLSHARYEPSHARYEPPHAHPEPSHVQSHASYEPSHARYEPSHVQSHARYEPSQSHARYEPSHTRDEPSHVQSHARYEPSQSHARYEPSHTRDEPSHVQSHARPEPSHVQSHARYEPSQSHARYEPSHTRDEPSHARYEPSHVQPHTHPEPAYAQPRVFDWTRDKLFQALNVEGMEISAKEKGEMKDLLWKYRGCFSTHKNDLGTCNMFEATINLKPDHIAQWTPSRPVPYKRRDQLQKELENLLEADVIEEAKERSNWNSPVFLVPKPGKKEAWRWVADMRGLNTQCLPDNFQLPNINYVADKVGGNTWYSTFDLSQSFHQVNYDEKSRPLTAFTCSGRRFWYKKMVMGHRNSAQQFSRCMAKLLANVPFDQLVAFLDDLLLASDDVTTHLSRLEYVLQRFAAAEMKLTPEKCKFLQKEVKYVGLTISQDGLRITNERVKAVRELLPPRSFKELQSVLGFLNYNRKFVKNFAALSKPLYDLLKRGKPFRWTTECQKGFDDIKERICEEITLCLPDLEDKLDSYRVTGVTLDASDKGLGAELSQIVRGERRVIAYYSARVPAHKRFWGQTKLEFLAMTSAIKHWQIYLKGTRQFTLVTDCEGLLDLNALFKKTNVTQVRKLQELAHYKFVIEHTSGEKNDVADFLSRYMYTGRSKHQSTQTEVAQSRPETSHMTQSRSETPHMTQSHSDTLDVEQPHPEKSHVAQSHSEIPHVTQSCPETLHSHMEQSRPETPHVHVEANLAMEHNVDTSAITIRTITGTRPESTREADPSQFTLSNLATAQRDDPILREVRSWVENGSKPETLQALRTPRELVSYWKQFSQFNIKGGVLRRKWTDVKSDDTRELVVIPEELKEEAMRLSHSTVLTSHPGAENSRLACLNNYYWYKMKDDFELFVAACTTCGKTKQPRAYLRAPLKHIILHQFNDAICIDHIVPSKQGRTKRGHRYILSITDMFSGYVIAIPTKTQTAEETINVILHNWTLRFGMSGEIISDLAPGFESHFFNTVLRAFGCKPTKGLPYKCSSTSKAERTNKRLNQALRAALTDDQILNWDQYLDYVCFALNSLRSRHTGYTANKIVFGRELNTPLSILLTNEEPMDLHTAQKSYGKKTYELHKEVKRIVHRVRKNANVDFGYADNCHNRLLHGPYFKEGDWCYTFVESPGHKFAHRWRGPFRIKKAINDHLYVVELEGGEKVCSLSKLKHYTPSRFSPTLLNWGPVGGGLPLETLADPHLINEQVTDEPSIVDLEMMDCHTLADQPRPEIPHVTQPRPETSHVSQSRLETPHVTQSRSETSHVEQSHPEASNVTQSRPETSHVAQSRFETPHVLTQSRSETPHVAQSRPETSHVTQSHPETSHVEQSRPKISHVEPPNVQSEQPRLEEKLIHDQSDSMIEDDTTSIDEGHEANETDDEVDGYDNEASRDEAVSLQVRTSHRYPIRRNLPADFKYPK